MKIRPKKKVAEISKGIIDKMPKFGMLRMPKNTCTQEYKQLVLGKFYHAEQFQTACTRPPCTQGNNRRAILKAYASPAVC